jgi:hypothetical protein
MSDVWMSDEEWTWEDAPTDECYDVLPCPEGMCESTEFPTDDDVYDYVDINTALVGRGDGSGGGFGGGFGGIFY